ncbi:MAG: CaiB/BaiF CoA transferase family protein [Dehalococcoidia bacterium]
MSDRPRPLDGVRVLDLSWFGAGPIAMRMLANLGADVVRIETQRRPDGLRLVQPRPPGNASLNVSGFYNNFNAEKRSITIDLVKPEGHALGLRLVEWADIFMTNMTNRAVRQVGMTWDVVRRANPGIIGLYEPMQGLTGPRTEFIGFGAVLSAITGLNHLAGSEEEPPLGVGTNYPDYVINPGHGVIAILAALRQQRRTGEGQLIDMSQLESTVAAMSGPVFAWDNASVGYRREGNRVPHAAPHNVYAVASYGGDTVDRWVAIACETDEAWRALAGAIRRTDWCDDRRFATVADRKAHEDEIDAAVGAWCAGRSGEEVVATLRAAGVPAGMVLNAVEVLHHPHLDARDYYAWLDQLDHGRRAYDGPGFRLSETPLELRRAAPMLGEHTLEVATEILGLSEDEIARLVADEVLY